MPKFPEIITTRAPAGTNFALEQIAQAEGRRPGDLVREAVTAFLASPRPGADEAKKAA